MARIRIGAIIKTFTTYLLLVAPPLAGLVAILHLGAGLRAPHAIGGDWQLALGETGTGPCAVRPDDDGRVILHVSQSGPRAEATLAGAARTALSLELRGDRLAGEGGSPAAPCGQAALDAQLAGGALVGVLRSPGCGRCPEVSFRATRAPAR